MPIIGFQLEKVSIERHNLIKGKVNVKTDMNFTKISEQTIKDLSKENRALKFDFDFTIKYNPDIATMEFKGHVLWLDKPEKAKQILEDWKTKKIEEELNWGIRNLIWTKCNIKAFVLEEEIGLPLHLPLPKLIPPKQQEKTGFVG